MNKLILASVFVLLFLGLTLVSATDYYSMRWIIPGPLSNSTTIAKIVPDMQNVPYIQLNKSLFFK